MLHGCAQDHGCTDEAIGQLCLEDRLVRRGILCLVQHVSCTVEGLLSLNSPNDNPSTLTQLPSTDKWDESLVSFLMLVTSG